MLTSQAIDGFALDIASGNFASRTVELYKSNLIHLCTFLGDPALETISLDDLKRFMIHLKTDYKPIRMSGSTDPLSGSAQDNHWKAIRTFFRWASETLPGVTNTAGHLPRPSYTSQETAPFTEDDIKRMLAALDYSKTFKRANTKEYHIHRPTALRDKAIIMTLLDTGVRIGELCRLEIQDVDLTTGELSVSPFSTGKKTKARIVHLGKATRRVLWLYLTKRGEEDPEERLFNIGPTPIRQMLKSLEKRSGVRDIHPHRFRHTFALEYLRNGGDVFTLQRLLGHRSLEMVQHYLYLAKTDIGEAHRRASPVDRWKL